MLKAFGLKNRLDKLWPLLVYSIFPLKSNDFVSCRLNELSYLRKNFASQDKTFIDIEGELSFFIGQPFVDDGQMDIDEYVSVVSSYASKFSGSCFYFPHRSEKASTADRIKEIANVHVKRYSVPVESVVLSNLDRLAAVAGISSTALFNVHVLNSQLPIYFYPVSNIKSFSPSLKQRLKVVESNLRNQDNTFEFDRV